MDTEKLREQTERRKKGELDEIEDTARNEISKRFGSGKLATIVKSGPMRGNHTTPHNRRHISITLKIPLCRSKREIAY